MKICFIADANSIHTHRWVFPLFKLGYSITLISYTPIKKDLHYNFRVIDLTKMTNLPRLRFLIWGIWLRSFIRNLQPDILHAHQIQAAGWLGAIANYHPFIVSSWGSDLLVEPQRSYFRRRLVKTVLDRCDRLVVASLALSDAARSLDFPANKMRMIPWGVETDVFRPFPQDRAETRREIGIDPDSLLVFSPRGISPIYQIHRIVEAYERVRQKCPGSRLLLLKSSFDPTYLAQIEAFIQDHKMEQEVIWLPRERTMEMEPMAKLYRAVDVTVSFPTSEGYGLTVYESIACGCPTIISDIRAFDDVLQDQVHTLKVPVADTLALSNAIICMCDSSNLRKSISMNALAIIDEMSVKARIAKTVDMYNEFVNIQ